MTFKIALQHLEAYAPKRLTRGAFRRGEPEEPDCVYCVLGALLPTLGSKVLTGNINRIHLYSVQYPELYKEMADSGLTYLEALKLQNYNEALLDEVEPEQETREVQEQRYAALLKHLRLWVYAEVAELIEQRARKATSP